MTKARNVRQLRFALAGALARAGASRTAEALAELDRALTEPGHDPSNARIQLAAGQLLETTDPGSALERYIKGMDGEPQAIVRARALLSRPDGIASLPALPSTIFDQAEAEARRNPSSDACLLVAGLLRQRGENERALDVLRLVEGRVDAPQDEVMAETADILVDLDRVDEAWQLIEGRGHGVRVASLQLARAKVHLLRGEFDDVLSEVEQLERGGVADQPDLGVIKALSLLGRGRADDALNALRRIDLPDALRARTVVYLARREYRQAGEASWDLLRARPANVDALLLRAQIALEAAGTGEAEADSVDHEEAGAPSHRPSYELDSARLLVEQVVKELDSLDPRSWWWRAQDVVRRGDGRYQFFRCELQLARGMPVTAEELDAVDRGTTTFLQDAALAVRKGELFAVDEPARAAEAFTEAGHLFRDVIRDYEGSFQCVSRAYRLDPTLPRAADYADGAVNASYVADVDSTMAVERLQQGIAAVEPLVVGASLDDLRGLVRPIAVLNARLAELSQDKVLDRSLRAARFCVSSLTLDSDDAYVSAVLAERLEVLGMSGAAMTFAHIAYDADAADPYYVETVIVAAVNFSGILAEVAPYLKRHAKLSEAVNWRNSIELECQLLADDRAAVSKGIQRPLVSDIWAVADAAMGLALIGGVPDAAAELGQAFDTSVASRPPDRDTAVDLACLLGRREDAQAQLAAAATSGNHAPWELDFMREKIEFTFDLGVSTEDFLGRALALCVSPRDVRRLVNLQLPLLAAAREGRKGPVPAVSVARRVVDARLEEVARRRERWQTEVDQCDGVLAELTRLWSALRVPGNVSAVIDITRGAPRPDTDKTLSGVIDGISRAALDKALADLPVQLVRSIADGKDAIDREGLRLVFDGVVDQPLPRRLALALLDDPVNQERLESLTAALGDGQVEETVDEILAGARSCLDVEAWWRLDDRLAAIQTTIRAVQDVIARTRTRLLDMLCDLLGMNISVQVDRPSYFSIILGSDFIPDDTGPGWELLRELIPAMNERIRSDTGFIMPGCAVLWDTRYPDSLWLMIYLRLAEAYRLPTHGFVRPATTAANHGLRDPLTGTPVVVEHHADRPAGSWTPLEFLMRHVERFAREHLAQLVGPWHVRESAERLGGDVLEHVTSDPVLFTRWLQLLREVTRTGALRDADAAAHHIAEAVLGPAYSTGARQPG